MGTPVVPGYEITDELARCAGTTVVRARPAANDRTCVLKVHNKAFPTVRELAKLRQEFEFGRRLAGPGIPTYIDYKTVENRGVLVIGDTDALPLESLLHQRGFIPAEDAVGLIRQLATTLRHVHEQGFVHKHVNAKHVLISQGLDKAWLIDFGEATPLKSEYAQLGVARIEGMLTHVSPEQTRRINYPLDQRSDLYSLGVCAYQMIAGHPPFYSEDPLELIHAHIAKEPTLEEKIRDRVPAVLWTVIAKMLAKAPEDRFNSANELLVALDQVDAAIAGNLDEGDIGSLVIQQFKIPQRLYGRDREKATLLSSFERAAEGTPELIVIGGYSGIGKTSLVFELQEPLVARRASFASAKFDQYKRNVPYASWVDIFTDVITQVLSDDKDKLKQWRSRVLSAVGKNAKILLDLAPGIEHVLGPQPELEPVVGEEVEKRFNTTLLSFIRCLASSEQPLVMFLDDLQWADSGTLSLLDLVLHDPEATHVLIIAAYRDNEVDETHPLTHLLARARQTSVPLTEIALAPLPLQDLQQMISHTLHVPVDEVAELANAVFDKTAGNPFFATQLLSSLHNDQIITYSIASGRWVWNLEGVRDAAISTNVVDLMTRRLQDLPSETQEVLKVAACIGNTFNLRTLSIVQDSSLGTVSRALEVALAAEVLLPVGDDYKLSYIYDLDTVDDQQILSAASGASFRFLHDRVQQASYSLTDEEKLPALHFRIAKLLHQALDADEVGESIFDIVNHFNLGRSEFEPGDSTIVAELNLRAANRAIESSAFATAVHYGSTARSLLQADAWMENYELAVRTHLECAQAQVLNGDYNEGLETLDIVEPHIRTTLEKCEVVELKLLVLKLQNDIEGAWRVGSAILAELGYPLAKYPDMNELQREHEMTLNVVRGIDSDVLVALPEMTSPTHLAACRLLTELWSVGYFSGSLNMHIAVMKIVRLSVEYGHSPSSVFGYMGVASALVYMFDEITEGHRLGEISLRLHERFQDRSVEAKILDLWGGLVQHYTSPVSEARATLWRGFTRGVEAGDYQWAGYCAMNIAHLVLTSRWTVDEAKNQIEGVLPTLRRYDPTMSGTTHILLEAIDSFRGVKSNPLSLKGEWCPGTQETIKRGREAGDNYTPLVTCLYKLLLCLVFREPSEIRRWERPTAETIHQASPGIWPNPYFHFLQSVALCDIMDSLEEDERTEARATLEHNLSRLSFWSEHAPENYAHMVSFIRGSVAAFSDDVEEAMRCYEDAAEKAMSQSFLLDGGLICERIADFYAELGAETPAIGYRQKGRYFFERWGGTAKVAQLDAAYPSLVSSSNSRSSDDSDTGLSDVNLLSVLKAARAISGTIEMHTLLDQLVGILIENAGATNGAIVVVEADGYTVRVRKRVGEDPVYEDRTTSEDQLAYKGISLRILNYVLRTKRPVLIDSVDSSEAEPFKIRPFVEATDARSILALPIVIQNEVKAAAFLYSTVNTHVFTKDRLATLDILCSQAAVSLENAKLLIAERTAARLNADLDAARVVQSALLPSDIEMQNFEVQATYKPAGKTGGDWYHYYYDKKTETGRFFLGDVTGHGIHSALVTAVVSGAVNTFEREVSLQDTLETEPERLRRLGALLDTNVARTGGGLLLMSFVAISIDLRSSCGYILTAGHPPLVLRRRDGQCEIVHGRGPLLGDAAGKDSFVVEKFAAREGDRYLIFTDGLIENEGPTGKRLSFKKLVTEFRACDGTLASAKDRIFAKASDIWEDMVVDDDIAVLLFERKSSGLP